MEFTSASKRAPALELMRETFKAPLKFGVPFLDDALMGIHQNDLITIGARSGVGKTQLGMTIALANTALGKRVHIFALEAYPGEIEMRMKFALLSKAYRNDETIFNRIKISERQWLEGSIDHVLSRYEVEVLETLDKLKNIYTYYKLSEFNVKHLLSAVAGIADETDLIILDHVHYVDVDDDNENRGLKEIAMAARNLSLGVGKPLVLMAHLRKKDRFDRDLAPGIDEFMGSSDLTKVATKVITFGKGERISTSQFETFVRMPKCRFDGSVTGLVGRLVFDYTQAGYLPGYEVGVQAYEKDGIIFYKLGPNDLPYWAKRAT